MTYNGRSPYEKYLITLCGAQMINLKVMFKIDVCLFIDMVEIQLHKIADMVEELQYKAKGFATFIGGAD